MSFSSAERRRANYVGRLVRSEDGQTWTGELTDMLGGQILLTGRVEAMGGKSQLTILARHGLTPEQKKIRREEQR